jgi:hypothetical protein
MRASEVGQVAHASTLFIQCFGQGQRTAAAPPAIPAPAAPAGPGGKAADDPSFRLVNRGAQAIAEFFATPSGSGTWGQNRLDAGALAPRAGRDFRLPRGACVYDLKVVFADKRTMERKGANLCRVAELPVP